MKFDGKNLERLQKERGESNYRLAKELGVHQTSIANWKSGTTPHPKHMKLLAVPWILFSLVEYIVLRSGGIAGPRAVGLLVGLAAIPLLFYGYKGVVGQGNMIVDILIFQVSVLLSFWVSWSLQKRRRLSGAGWTVLGLLVLLGVWALFLLFTFRAPDLAVFVDPLTGMRGIG